MAVTPQHATATADVTGRAVFTFPDVPQGELWCGTTQIPGAPASAVGMVYASGELLGSMAGPGSFGPWIAGATRRLSIVMTGLAAHTQYQAVWHADDKGTVTTTYPAPITPTVVAGGGEVTVANFPNPQAITGSVVVLAGHIFVDSLPLAPFVVSDSISVTASPRALPENPPTCGVILSGLKANTAPVYVGDASVTLGVGIELPPGTSSVLLPVADSDELYVVGTSGDVVSFLVI